MMPTGSAIISGEKDGNAPAIAFPDTVTGTTSP